VVFVRSKNVNMAGPPHTCATSCIIFVSTTDDLAVMLATLANLPVSPPSLYIDLEGQSLSRNGTIALLTLYVSPWQLVYLVDVSSLQASTFSTPAIALDQTSTFSDSDSVAPQATLKSILESATIPKVFFDVRNDSDALFAHYGIKLSCIHDLQVMELATRTLTSGQSRNFLCSLSTCIRDNAGLCPGHFAAWKASKEAGNALFDSEKGGNCAVFETRPLSTEIERYCVQDVLYMPLLWRVFEERIQEDCIFEESIAKIKGGAGFWDIMAREAAVHRVNVSWEPWYRPSGSHKRMGCWNDEQIQEARRRWTEGWRDRLCD